MCVWVVQEGSETGIRMSAPLLVKPHLQNRTDAIRPPQCRCVTTTLARPAAPISTCRRSRGDVGHDDLYASLQRYDVGDAETREVCIVMYRRLFQLRNVGYEGSRRAANLDEPNHARTCINATVVGNTASTSLAPGRD
jgi:hypothetical protein